MTDVELERFYQMLGERVRKARIHAGLTQETFGNFLKLSRVSIVNIEKGRQRPPIHLLVIIAKLLNLKVPDLLPDFLPSDKLSPEWEKIISKQVYDHQTKEKLIGFIEEVQLNNTNSYVK